MHKMLITRLKVKMKTKLKILKKNWMIKKLRKLNVKMN